MYYHNLYSFIPSFFPQKTARLIVLVFSLEIFFQTVVAVSSYESENITAACLLFRLGNVTVSIILVKIYKLLHFLMLEKLQITKSKTNFNEVSTHFQKILGFKHVQVLVT